MLFLLGAMLLGEPLDRGECHIKVGSPWEQRAG